MKRLWALLLALALLAGCAPAAEEDGKAHILCTTYPVYLFTTAVVGGVPDTQVDLLVNQQVSCLHDYTLTVTDMGAIDRADVIVMSGGGLEEFMDDALAQSKARVIDCSEGMTLFPAPDHHHHDGEDAHDHEVDPHYWMDPGRACGAMGTVAARLSELWPMHQEDFQANLAAALDQVKDSAILRAAARGGPSPVTGELITFHDGFQYFADTFGLELLASIEEDEGSEASAKELEKIIGLVEQYNVPAIFVEKNGSRRSADVIAQETGCSVYQLDLLMSGEDVGIEPYIQAMERNLATIKEALG